MKKRFWLKPFSIVLAALASAAASASTKATQNEHPSLPPLAPETTGSIPGQGDVGSLLPNSEKEFLFGKGGDLFKFILEKTGTGDLILSHYSHRSHSSHASHESHSSHFSSRY